MNNALKRGLNVPSLTIVDDSGRVIPDQQRRLIRHIIQDGHGTDTVFGNGTTGEWNRLANAERLRVIELTIDEVGRVNRETGSSVEAWVGVNGQTRAEVLTNLEAALSLGADAAVIAPLAIDDLRAEQIVPFFHREITTLIEASSREIPIFLYDNADIVASGNVPHVPTRIVKQLSRLPWVRGIKVSASRSVIGNYTRAAMHYKLPGEFGIYIGNAQLIFEIYRSGRGLLGRLRDGWRDFLLHDAVPIGVVSGPGNVMPREWQKAWRVCWAGDEASMDLYHELCGRFDQICSFDEGGRRVTKMIAGLKYALELDGVITAGGVLRGTAALTSEQKSVFIERHRQLRESIAAHVPPRWQTTTT